MFDVHTSSETAVLWFCGARDSERRGLARHGSRDRDPHEGCEDVDLPWTPIRTARGGQQSTTDVGDGGRTGGALARRRGSLSKHATATIRTFRRSIGATAPPPSHRDEQKHWPLFFTITSAAETRAGRRLGLADMGGPGRVEAVALGRRTVALGHRRAREVLRSAVSVLSSRFAFGSLFSRRRGLRRLGGPSRSSPSTEERRTSDVERSVYRRRGAMES